MSFEVGDDGHRIDVERDSDLGSHDRWDWPGPLPQFGDNACSYLKAFGQFVIALDLHRFFGGIQVFAGRHVSVWERFHLDSFSQPHLLLFRQIYR